MDPAPALAPVPVRLPPGLFGTNCATCYNDAACAALTKSEGAWCFNTTM